MHNKKRVSVVIALIAVAFSMFSSRTIDQPSSRKDAMVAAWERAKVYTKEYLDAATDDVYPFKPTPEMRSFAEQMLHLAVDNYKLTNAAITGVATPMSVKDLEKEPPALTKVELTKSVMESYDFVIAVVKNLDEAKLGAAVKMFNRWDTTVEDGLNKAFEHQTHHRGQTTVYLRLKGITPPKEKLF